MKLLKSYRTEIDPSLEQIKKINQTIGVCRFVYNLFIFKNEERYKAKEKYINNVWHHYFEEPKEVEIKFEEDFE